MEQKHPACKSCDTEYVWDWEMDEYRAVPVPPATDWEMSEFCDKELQHITLREFLDGSLLMVDGEEDQKTIPLEADVDVVNYHYCVRCGALLGASVSSDDHGSIELKRKDWPTWQGVDWQDHAYEGGN